MWLIYQQYSSPRTAVYRFRQALVQEHCGSPFPIFYGNFNLSSLNATIADIVLEAVRGGIGGAVVAVVLSKIGD